MSFVLDASVAIAWGTPDEQNDAADYAVEMVIRNGAVVPELWFLEVTNTLLIQLRRGRIDRARLGEMIADFEDFNLKVDHETADHAFGQIRTLVERHRLTVYDATYLELAIRKSLPIATLDRALAAAAKLEGVPEVLPPA